MVNWKKLAVQRLGRRRVDRIKYALRHPGMGLWAVLSGLDTRPFSVQAILSEKGIAESLAEVERAGMRLLPYPAVNIVALVSDLDAATRYDVSAYHGLLIRRYGLDFGDSFRLHQRSSRGIRTEPLAFFDCDGGIPYSHDHSSVDYSRDTGFIELVREFHRGNLDHFHSFSAFGPRVMLLNDVSSAGSGQWSIAVPTELEKDRTGQFEFKSFRVPVCTVAVCTKGQSLSDEARLVFVRRKGEELEYIRSTCKERSRYRIGLSSWKTTYFDVPLNREGHDDLLLGSFEKIMVLDPRSGSRTEVKALYLMNVDGYTTQRLLVSLQEKWNIATNLITDHASKHFVNPDVEDKMKALVTGRYGQGSLPSLFIGGDIGDLRFSAVGDDKRSMGYLLSYLVDTFGIRFINPSGSSGEPGERTHVLNITPPMHGRDKTRLFGARRMAPQLPADTELPKNLKNNMGTETFSDRMRRLLERSAGEADQAWPFYTHLGNTKNREREPYFDERVLAALQDRVMNISGSTSPEERIGFVSASRLYEYALMVRLLPKHVVREGRNTIRIAPWVDSHTKQQMPRSIEHLHGITFFVEDRAEAEVWLGDQKIENLVRNPSNKVEGDSVTIVAGRISHVLLDEIPVDEEVKMHHEGGVTSQWSTNQSQAARGSKYLQLKLQDSGASLMKWCPQDIDATGSQHFAYSVKRHDPQVRCGVMIETQDGGRFYFGDSVSHPSLENVNADYSTPQLQSNLWERRVIPLVDLNWRTGSVPGDPLPASMIASVNVVVEGPAGSVVDLDAVEFLRSGSLRTSTPKVCVLGGRVEGVMPNLRLVLSYDGSDGQRVVRDDACVDGTGFFAFTGVPRDQVVELYAETEGQRVNPSNGPFISVQNDALELVIRKPAS